MTRRSKRATCSTCLTRAASSLSRSGRATFCACANWRRPAARRGLRPKQVERQSMPDLLLEFFSEEIPARMQARAADDLKKLITDRLVNAGLVYEGAKAFATPRRLAMWVQGLPARQPDVREEKKGPR